MADAQSIEEEFSRCSHFLISCLLSHIKRGSFPHRKYYNTLHVVINVFFII